MDINDLIKRVKIYTGMDLNCYNPNMLQRRLKSLLAKVGVSTLDEYWELIRKDYNKLRGFLDYVTINVTKYFRDPIKFLYCQEVVIPEILKKNPKPLIWCCACSSGEEPYSIAMILEELGVDKDVKILATDIDSEALSAASRGVYKEASVENVSKELLNKYFTFNGDTYEVKPKIKDRVIIKHFNLISDNYKRDYFDLILCRNVIIHFARNVKTSLFSNFNSALKTDGFLFLGSSEKMLYPEKYGFKHNKYEVYQKRQNLS